MMREFYLKIKASKIFLSKKMASIRAFSFLRKIIRENTKKIAKNA